MIDQERLRERLVKVLNQHLHVPAKEVHLDKLAGDGSNRAYCRLSWKEDDALHSFIVMVLADPEAFKASEEAGSGEVPSIKEIPFINIQKHLLNCKLPVPEIIDSNLEEGWILLEDLGDVTLAQEIEGQLQNRPFLFGYYQKAIDTLITLQIEASSVPNPPTIAHHRQFDQALFLWEFDHFIEYGIEKRKRIVLPKQKKKEIRAYFIEIACHLAEISPVYVHRDYHSRNLMIQPGPEGKRIRLIDFQDALMGPPQYDLASLLRDSYINLPEELVDALIQYYIEELERRAEKPVERERFRELFDLASIQRNLKAAGRFVYFDQVKHKSQFLLNVPPTLLKVKHNLLKYEKLRPLHHLLIPYVSEFQ
ncbi:MAG: aminoglycoside phosphotransferase family protein [Nitrospiria bacterium]